MSRAGDAGFTLIEMLIVLAIMAAGLLAAQPLLSRGKTGVELRSVASTLAADLSRVRSAAVAQNRDARLTIAANGYLASTEGWRRGFPEGVAFAGRIALTGDERERVDIVFRPDGSSNGAQLRLRANERAMIVQVDPLTGRVRVQE